MKNIILLIGIAIVFSSCIQNNDNSDLNAELEKKSTEIEQLKSDLKQQNSANIIVHTVYFKLKEDISDENIEALILEIKKLEEIPHLNNLRVGKFKDLGDKRALSEYVLVMYMDFINEAEYKKYQEHQIHHNLKTAVKPFVDGIATHDFLTK